MVERFGAFHPARKCSPDCAADHERGERSHLALHPMGDVAGRVKQPVHLRGCQRCLAKAAGEFVDPIVHVVFLTPLPNLLFLLRYEIVNWTPLPVPWAVQAVDRIPKQRYYDEKFYGLEAELFWPKVWQMACRLEEIPARGDFVEYEILDQSVIVVRVDDDNVRAFYNSCRHRGMKIVQGCGSRRNFVCPFHGWCWSLDGASTFVLRPEIFDQRNLESDDLGL